MINPYPRLLLLQLKWNWLYHPPARLWLLTTAVFHLVWGFFSSQQLQQIGTTASHPTLVDALFFAFSGPSPTQLSLLPFLAWLLFQLFFFMLSGHSSNQQLQNPLLLLAIGSRRKWWHSLLLSLLTLAMLYTAVALIATLLGNTLQLGWHPQSSLFFSQHNIWQAVSTFSLWQLTITLYALMASSLFLLALIQAVIALYSHRSIWGLVGVTAVALCVGLTSQTIFPIEWLPPTQLILSRHAPFDPTWPHFTVPFSLCYNLLGTLFLAFLGYKQLATIDFLGETNHD